MNSLNLVDRGALSRQIYSKISPPITTEFYKLTDRAICDKEIIEVLIKLIAEATANFENIDSCLSNFHANLTKFFSFKSPDFYVPINSLDNSLHFMEYFEIVLKIVIFRLSILSSRVATSLLGKARMTIAIDNIFYILIKTQQEANEDLKIYLTSVVLNASRSYLEDGFFLKSLKTSNALLNDNLIVKFPDQINPEIQEIIFFSKKFLVFILESKRFSSGLMQFIEFYYGKNSKNLDKIEIIKVKLKEVIESKLYFFEDGGQYGMIGPNSKVYLEINNILIDNPTSGKNFIIATTVHEIGHQTIRICENNSFSMTPKKTGEGSHPWESGYLFETMVFHVVITKIDDNSFLTNPEYWNDLTMEFSEELFQRYEENYKEKNFYLSGYCHEERESLIK